MTDPALLAQIGTVLAILAALLIGAMVPGPSFLLVCKASLARSRTHGIVTATGMGVGATIFATLALAGVAHLLTEVRELYWVLKAFGGCYLLFIALRMWRDADRPLAGTGDIPFPRKGSGLTRTFSMAVLAQLSNPKTALIHASIFAAVLPSPVPLWELVAIPPLVFIMETAWYGLVAVAFSSQRPQQAYRRSKRWLDRVAGVVMGALGLRLLSGLLGSRP